MKKKDLMDIMGRNIRKYRIAASMTQEELAESINVSTSFITRVENGQRMMSIPVLQSVAQVLGVGCDAILNETIPEDARANLTQILFDKPEEFVRTIEEIVRLCADKFTMKRE